MNQSLSLPSFAKINWSLRILGKRPDDLHEIRTTLQTISLHDRLSFQLSESDEVALICSDAEIPTDDRNLVVRAAHALRGRYSIRKGARIQLEKNIPAEAGLGGGSSNAAVALLALAHLWRIDANAPDLLAIAALIGADVPFFLFGGAMLGTGIGTTLTPLPDVPEHHLIIIAPTASVSTREAYASVQAVPLTSDTSEFILSSSQNAVVSDDSPPWLRNDFGNDFESVIFDIYPEIRRAKELLLAAGASAALMTGSGSSVFGVFADKKSQQQALEKIQCEAGWRIFPCVTLSRNEYRRAIGDELFRSYAL
ncbi:MAG: 4-diphosphocytidyl-2-C-methyl-D-erythritol kinase [Pyrinomonadaceae bacterium]|nr:4-diphosphocytidyl-2-C-methyl-D-erythritol kinase [Pyrinomonadaceae bacterium]